MLLADAEFRTNNLGFIAHRDFTLEKFPGEFRIAVLGGEQTSSSVLSVSWPEHLEGEMRRRHPGRNITMLNLGWPDAGPVESLRICRTVGERLRPDAIILYLIENDIVRAANSHP